MDATKLKEILEKHVKWLMDEGGERADLNSANLRSADLRFANLRSADLSFADLSSADLRFANLSSADLRSADLSFANLSSADLRFADLSFANLSSADLRFANLSFADLRSAEGIDWELWKPQLYLLKEQDPTTKLTAYKFLNSDLKSPFQSYQFEIGKTYICKDANKDETEDCGAGWNLATLSWCKRNMNPSQVIVKCSFLVKDIVAVPLWTDGKFRVRKMKVESIMK